jgi:hypothetical protein
MTLMRGIMTLAVIVGNMMFTSALALRAAPAPAGSGGDENRTIQQAAAEHLDAVEAGNAMKYGGFRTKEYFDAVQAGKEPDLRPLTSKYGTKEFIREMARQVRTRNSELLALYVLDCARCGLIGDPSTDGEPLAEMAREALDSPSDALRVMAARGYTNWWPQVPEDLRKKAGEIIRRRFAESKGEECRGEMFTIRAREDAPMVREIYEAHYRRFLPPVIDTPLEYDPDFKEKKDAMRALGMLFLLAELGDRDAAKEIMDREPEKVQKLRRETVEERMSHPVSLEADVAAYLDFTTLRRDYVTLKPLYDLYGQETWFQEAIRQAEERKSEYLIDRMLATGSDLKYDCLRALALKNLESDTYYIRGRAVWWCERNADALSQAERDRYAQVVRQWFFASDGREGYRQMMRGVATPADLPLIRSLYDRRCKTPKPGDPPLYSCANAFRGNINLSRSDILLLLARLGDAAALREIRAAIEQEKDPQQRLWGILMAAQLEDRSLVPLIAKALDDKRPSEEPIDSDSGPQVVSPSTMYTRVCDLAVRAIHDLDPPREPWPFRVPLARGWRVALAYQSFDFKQELGKGWELLDEHTTVEVVNRRVLVGFTDDQIEYARRYAAREIQ